MTLTFHASVVYNGVFTRSDGGDRRGDRSHDRSRRSVVRPIAVTIASCKHRVMRTEMLNGTN